MTETLTTASTRQPEERKATLAREVGNQVRSGWRVESQTDYQAVLAKGKRTSHGLHIFLSIITLGFWIPVWILMTVLNRDRHRVVEVDPFGNLSVR